MIRAPFKAIMCLIHVGMLLIVRSVRSVGIESKHRITLGLKSLKVSCSIWRRMVSCSSIFLTIWKMFSMGFKQGLLGIWWNSAWMSECWFCGFWNLRWIVVHYKKTFLSTCSYKTPRKFFSYKRRKKTTIHCFIGLTKNDTYAITYSY